MEQSKPRLSVIMAVYNGERFLRQTMDSIISQTFDSFEVIVIDDASTDDTGKILSDYSAADQRIKVVTNETNLRLANSLNKAVGLAAGKYIVRMDADDICLADRFEKQYRYMEENPDVGLSFCRFFALKGDDIIPCGIGRGCDSASIKAMLLFFCPVLHPGVIARTELMKRYDYDPRHTCSEDLDLWTRMAADGVKITCSGDYLMLYRIHDMSITSKTPEKQKQEVLESERRYYNAMLSGIPAGKEDFYINGVYFRSAGDVKRLLRFYKYILSENRKKGMLSKKAVTAAVTEVLAEYRRNNGLNFRDKFLLPQFGGIGFVREVIRRKRQGKKDLIAADKAAVSAGFVRRPGEVPVYCFWSDD